jgi:hypothetical protein
MRAEPLRGDDSQTVEGIAEGFPDTLDVSTLFRTKNLIGF